MASKSLLSALGSFSRDRNQKISGEQEKQDRLTERMRQMQIAGVKTQQDKYDKQKAYYDGQDGLLGAEYSDKNHGGIESAMIRATKAGVGNASAQDVKVATGKDKTRDVDYAVQYKQMRDRVDFFRKNNTRPELTPADIEKIHARRGIDNLAFEGSIRNLFGIESKAYHGTDLIGLKELYKDTSAGVTYKDKTVELKDYNLNATDKATINSLARTVFTNKWSKVDNENSVLPKLFESVIDPTTGKAKKGAISQGQSYLYSIFKEIKGKTKGLSNTEAAAAAIKTLETWDAEGFFVENVAKEGFFGDDTYLELTPRPVNMYRKNPSTGKWKVMKGVPPQQLSTMVATGWKSEATMPARAVEALTKQSSRSSPTVDSSRPSSPIESKPGTPAPTPRVQAKPPTKLSSDMDSLLSSSAPSKSYGDLFSSIGSNIKSAFTVPEKEGETDFMGNPIKK